LTPLTPPPTPRPPLPRWLDTLVLVALIGALASVGTYAIVWFIFNGGPPKVRIQSVPIDATAEPSSYDFAFPSAPVPVPDLAFADASGRKLSLSDFRGRPIVLNIWATWCVPCRKEMPSLDRLQAKFDPSKLLVVTVSIDFKGAAVVTAFYQELGLRSLGVYVDATGSAASKLGMPGVPGTVLIDTEGREVGRKLGPAEWDSPEIAEVLRQHLGIATTEGRS
jgi:thiol-disulfide isomerase/thioredoxin